MRSFQMSLRATAPTKRCVLVLSQVNRQLALNLGTTPLSPFIIDDGQGLYLTKGRLNAVSQT